MPVASVTTDTKRVELKSCPGGFVELRAMPYGKYLKRQEMALKVRIMAQRGQDATGEMNMSNKDVTVFEFSECIVNHNLEVTEGQQFDFRSHAAVELLDPKIGMEISQHIDEMHGNVEDGGQGNFTNGSSES